MVEDSWAGVSRHARGGSEMEIDNENEMPQLRSMGKGVRGVGEGMEGGLAEGLKNSLRGAGGGNKNAGGKGATDLIVSASLVNVKDKRLRSLLGEFAPNSFVFPFPNWRVSAAPLFLSVYHILVSNLFLYVIYSICAYTRE